MDASVNFVTTIDVGNFPATQPVSGSVSVSSLPSLAAGSAVIGHVVVDSAGSVSVTSLPSIPAGSNVIGHVVVDSVTSTVTVSGSVAVSSLPSLAAGTNAIGSLTAGTAVIGHVIVDSAGSVSITSLPALPAGSNVIGHVIVDSGSITVSGSVTVSGTVAVSSLPALVAGTAVIGHVITDTGSTVAVSALPALPAGANAIGSVTVTSAPTTAVTIASLPALAAGTATIGKVDQGAAGASAWPVSLASVPSHAVTITGTSQQAVANSITVVGPSDVTIRTMEGAPLGASWIDLGATTLTPSGSTLLQLVAAASGRRLRNVHPLFNVGASVVNVAIFNGNGGSSVWGTYTNLIDYFAMAANTSGNIRDYSNVGKACASGAYVLVSTTGFNAAYSAAGSAIVLMAEYV